MKKQKNMKQLLFNRLVSKPVIMTQLLLLLGILGHYFIRQVPKSENGWTGM